MSEAQSKTTYSTNLIHGDLGGSTAFWRDFTLAELMLFIAPAFLALVVFGMPFVPSSLVLPIVGLLIAMETMLYALHQVRPSYYRLSEWLYVRLKWAITKEEYTHGDGNQDTASVTRLERVMPHGIERVDGAHLAAVEVTPANLALQDEGQWERAVQSLTDLTKSLEGESKIYITTQQVDNKDFIEAHIDRLADPDVSALPILQGLLARFEAIHTDEDGSIDPDSEMHRRYYIVVSVTDSDIDELEREDYSLFRYFEGIPIFGRFCSRFTTPQIDASQREQLKRQKLDDRVTTVHRAVNSLYRCKGNVVTPFELAQVLKEYWSCRPGRYGDPEEVFGLSPISYTTDGGEQEFEEGDDVEVVDTDTGSTRPGDKHRGAVAPAALDWSETHAVINSETYARTFWIETFPERPSNGLLEKLLLDTTIQADISIHIDPYDSQDAVDIVSGWISELRVIENDVSNLRADDIRDDIERAKYIRDLVRRNQTSLFRAGVFIRLTADSKDALREQTNKLETVLRDSPANCSVKRATRRHKEGMVTVSPIGRNELGQDRLSAFTGEALGSLFPFSSNYLSMEGGIEYGTHGHNGSALRIDPWGLETGHSELVTGMPGGGKTHGSQARALRMMKRRKDVKQIYIDPVGDMRGSAEALGAKTVTLSGDTPLNPCEMHPTPEHILEQSPDMEPVAAKKEEVYAVIENFLEARDVDLEMHSGVITFAIGHIFEESAIDPDDPSTHTPENSPTMTDFLDFLEELEKNPGEYGISSSNKTEELVSNYAGELSVALHPFRVGSTFGNLSQDADLNLLDDGAKTVYLDLQQVEGTTDGLGKQSFVMQLLLSNIYQQAKYMDEKVEVIVDEAHYLFDDSANLSFLNQIARHQRHAGLRLVLLSQTLSEFYDEGVAEEIAKMCPIKVHHREPELDDTTAANASLTAAQQYYIQHAEAGKDSIGTGQGYSEALVRVDEQGDYPTTIETTAVEKRVIEFSAGDRAALEELIVDDAPDGIEAFEELVYSEAMETRLTRRHGLSPEQAKRVLSGLSEDEIFEGISRALEASQSETAADD